VRSGPAWCPGSAGQQRWRRRAEALERARLALEAANPPTATRGDVPPGAAAGAELCVTRIRTELSLRTNTGRTEPAPADIRATLDNAGLTEVVVDGPSFAGSSGQACLLGTSSAGKTTFTIAPLPGDGHCRPD
jgi:hypothetical protein